MSPEINETKQIVKINGDISGLSEKLDFAIEKADRLLSKLKEAQEIADRLNITD